MFLQYTSRSLCDGWRTTIDWGHDKRQKRHSTFRLKRERIFQAKFVKLHQVETLGSPSFVFIALNRRHKVRTTQQWCWQFSTLCSWHRLPVSFCFRKILRFLASSAGDHEHPAGNSIGSNGRFTGLVTIVTDLKFFPSFVYKSWRWFWWTVKTRSSSTHVTNKTCHFLG